MIKEAATEGPPMPEGGEKPAEGQSEESGAKGSEIETSEKGSAADKKRTRDAAMPQAAGTIMMDVEGNILILKRGIGARDYPDTWDLPGGHLEAGETAPKAAIRESREEVGQAPSRLDKIDQSSEYGVQYSTYLSGVGSQFEPKLSDEHSDYKWVSLADALNEDLHPGLRNTLTKLKDQRANSR
jgi:8-oxo-dGTP pyrophosphatase MutT (NUDIX family)